MPPTKDKRKLRTRKKEHTRNTIIDEAIKLFNEKPYDEVLLEDIADAAFISRQTLYNYFNNKEDIHYAVGHKIYEEENEEIEKILETDLTGKEQVLRICERLFTNSDEKPIVLKVVKDLWNNLNSKNFSSSETYNRIAETVGKETMDELIEKPGALEEFEFEEYFDDPNLMQEYLQFIRHNYLWTKAIQKGKQDGTIKNQLPDMQIMQFMSFVTWGTINEVMRRRSPLERVGLDMEMFSTNVIRLLSHFLDDYE
ncbi:MAG: TetR/AcrR family transcriptional regulator [Candidatus Bathyarchaeota archaeon]|nr:TetR/AcrR family transcriptional regulator [Candidatus Bathyarchaeota archaeon]